MRLTSQIYPSTSGKTDPEKCLDTLKNMDECLVANVEKSHFSRMTISQKQIEFKMIEKGIYSSN